MKFVWFLFPFQWANSLTHPHPSLTVAVSSAIVIIFNKVPSILTSAHLFDDAIFWLHSPVWKHFEWKGFEISCKIQRRIGVQRVAYIHTRVLTQSGLFIVPKMFMTHDAWKMYGQRFSTIEFHIFPNVFSGEPPRCSMFCIRRFCIIIHFHLETNTFASCTPKHFEWMNFFRRLEWKVDETHNIYFFEVKPLLLLPFSRFYTTICDCMEFSKMHRAPAIEYIHQSTGNSQKQPNKHPIKMGQKNAFRRKQDSNQQTSKPVWEGGREWAR